MCCIVILRFVVQLKSRTKFCASQNYFNKLKVSLKLLYLYLINNKGTLIIKVINNKGLSVNLYSSLNIVPDIMTVAMVLCCNRKLVAQTF